MDDEKIIKIARVLSSDYGLRILRTFSGDEWKIASEISSLLGMHTSTASKYLDLLFREGLLQRRLRKTSRRPTFEYRLNHPTILFQIDLSGQRKVDVLVCWSSCLEVFHKLVRRLNSNGMADEIESLIESLKDKSGIENVDFFDPRFHLAVAKRLIAKKLETNQLSKDPSTVEEVARLVFEGVRALCAQRIGATATDEVFGSIFSKLNNEDCRILTKLGLAQIFKRDLSNE